MGREHWIEAPLNNLLLTLESGSRPKGGVKGIDEGVPSIGAEHLTNDGGFNFTNIRYVPDSFAKKMNRGIISHGDILIVKDGATTGKVSFVSNDFPFKFACTNEHVFICRIFDLALKEYIFYFLRSHTGQEQIMSTFHGGAQGGINSEFSNAVNIPLPPLSEQKRIVEKLDAILPKVKSTKTRLEKIPLILKKFRQSVLAAACSGRLTEDWRDGKDLPEWEEVRFEDVGTIGRGKSQHRPRNDPKLYNGAYPFIQTGDIAQSNGYIVSHSQSYNEIGLDQSKLWPANTLCITIAANIANTSILTYPACFPDSVVGFISNPERSHVKFIKWVIDTIKNNLENYAPATAQKNINLGILNDVIFLCPTVEEQNEIVERVEKLFTLADSLETKYNKAMGLVDNIEKSVLAKAFRGELVDPDPDDEPAGALLARILEEKGKSEDEGRSRKARKRKG